MPEELSYLIITPYSLKKSRTGGIIARLLSRTDLELVAARILAPSQEFAENYAESLYQDISKRDKRSAKLYSNYVRNNFAPLENGKRERIMILLFKGDDACRKLYDIAGNLVQPVEKESVTGETIRDTYADYVLDRAGRIQYFEPAVLSPPNAEFSLQKLKYFASFASEQPNIVENIVREDEEREQTLAIIKPDNWRHPSTKPGNIIDMFSRTGLRIVGCKVFQMSVADALEFYGPVKEVLRKKLSPKIAEKAKEILEKELDFNISGSSLKKLEESVGMDFADSQFYQIVEFMSGRWPENLTEEEIADHGKVKCMILIYEGPHAISAIRTVLGPTDPSKAPGGTIRREFGHDVMVNTAHASDAPESVEREKKIVKIDQNSFSLVINEYLDKVGYKG